MVLGADPAEPGPQRDGAGQVEGGSRVGVVERPDRVLTGELGQRQGQPVAVHHPGHGLGGALLVGVDGPQHLVAVHDVLERPVQGADVERAADAGGHRHVVGGAAGLQLVDEPEAALCEGEHRRVGGVTGRGIGVLPYCGAPAGSAGQGLEQCPAGLRQCGYAFGEGLAHLEPPCVFGSRERDTARWRRAVRGAGAGAAGGCGVRVSASGCGCGSGSGRTGWGAGWGPVHGAGRGAEWAPFGRRPLPLPRRASIRR